MNTIKSIAGYCVVMLVLLLPVSQVRAGERTIGFFVGDSDAFTCVQAIKGLDLPQVELAVFTQEDIHSDRIKDFINHMDIAVVDIMPRQPPQWHQHGDLAARYQGVG